jgi:hypothetical protein
MGIIQNCNKNFFNKERMMKNEKEAIGERIISFLHSFPDGIT